MKFILITLLIAAPAFGHGDAESTSTGKGKGVESFDEHDGFVLSKEANKRLDIQAQLPSTGKSCDFKAAQIVSTLGKKVVFVVRNGKYLSIPTECSSLQAGDRIVSKGADFLRVIQMDLQSGEEGEENHDDHKDEHGHEDGHDDEHGDEHADEKGGKPHHD